MTIFTIPGYLITTQLYSGTRTQVYRGISEAHQQSVVIKLLKSEYPTFNELLQFRNQYTITKNLYLPGVVKHLKLEPYRHSLALIMEDFGGVSLSEYIIKNSESKNYPFPMPGGLKEFINIAIQIVQALEGLYQNRIIHKDIKPQNILINPQSKLVKLIDFSISSLLPSEFQEIQNPNVLEGTLAYMSPEQTGRMNRGIDYRTDFYSLGVTFYELLTGQLPFQSNDAMELVHCHIARLPIPPIQINQNIPPIINAIVIKMMAKNSQDRYQTAFGIKYDLERCLEQYSTQGSITSFKLGERDISERFAIPEKLYGREAEVATLLAAFERVADKDGDIGDSSESKTQNPKPQIELMLVAGFSGIGKTVVVNEVHKPIVRQRGYFLKGKFDQFKRDIPFSALVQAFQNLMQQLLTETAAAVQKWKTQILSALGENSQVIIDVIPELEQIIGKQQPVPELEGNAAQNRFNLLLQKFIRVLATKEHPLVIFLDDLQWADLASLKLIQLLMSDHDTQYLLLIGAYRDNEVNPAHPLMLTLDEIRKAKGTINQINLKPLNRSNLNQLIADSLSCPPEITFTLTDLVYQKTKGNPFFSNQFLKALPDYGLISFDFNCGYWQCDIAQIRELSLTDDVVEFMAVQLQKLPQSTQEVLKLAACIGNQFDLATLAIVYEKSQAETAAALWKALQESLVIPISEAYKFFQEDAQVQEFSKLSITNYQLPSYKFLHDRVQQAAYFLIPENQKQSIHLKIGRLLLKNTPETEREEKIFDLVNQLNIGVDLIADQRERNQLAQLNLLAGRKAKTSTAYAAAIDYLTVGRKLLATDSWLRSYDLTINLYVEAVEAEYLNTNFEQSQQLAEVVLQNANTLLDKVKVYEAQIQSYISQNQMKAAVDTGLQVLEMLGVSLAINLPTQVTIEELINLPKIQQPEKNAALRILSTIASAAYLASPELYPRVVFTMADICSKYGNSAPASYAYACCSLICEVTGEIELGYQFGQLSLKLLDKFQAKEFASKVIMVYGACVRHWKEHGHSTIASLLEAVKIGLETGDIEYACYGAMYLCIYSFFSGEELNSVVKKYEQYIALMLNLKQDYQINYTKIWQNLALNIYELSTEQSQLHQEKLNEEELLRFLKEANNISSLFGFYFSKLFINYLLNNTEQAVKNAQLADNYTAGVGSLMMIPQHNFYYSLALLAQYSNAQASEQEEYLKQVEVNQEKMATWAYHAPMNYQHKYELVEAEKARVLGQRLEAMDYYEQAIAGAKKNDYLQEEALAYELAAKFYLTSGKQTISQTYITNAYYAYARWGAKAKVADLEQRYPQLLAPIFTEVTTSKFGETIFQTIAASLNSTSTSSSSGLLDLATVIKASQALSGEVKLDKLLTTLMLVSIENAGAQKGALILSQQDNLLIEATAIIGNSQTNILQSIPIEQSQEICRSLVNYVHRTSETLVFDDASTENMFSADPYIIQQQPKSILCTPIIHQGKAIGILYLENNLTTGAFTPDRLEVLKILSSQAAISIENARLYQTLEDKVAERTAQLQAANQEISTLNERLKQENLRMSAELEITKQLQQMVLPKQSELDAVEGLEIAGFMEPADEVGGDYYDVLQQDGRVKIAIGDVTGHGLESGVLMLMTQTAVRTLQESNQTDPVQLLSILNRTIYGNIQRINPYKNLTLTLLDYAEGTLNLSGQHESIIVARTGGIVELIDTKYLGFPIGIEEEIADFIDSEQVHLNSGDVVVLYTDGITEAFDINQEEYGLERLCEVVSRNWENSAQAIKQAVIEDLRLHIGEQKVFDDITLVVLKQK